MMRFYKMTTYGVMHLIVAMAVAYAISGSWVIALGIGTIEPLVQTFAYSIHERMWERLGWREIKDA
jgi:uncharacterized membrane protein